MEKICVAVRFRPPLSQDNANLGTTPSSLQWRIDDNRISLHSPLGTPISGVSFAFDHVFEEGCTNLSVYERHTKDVIEAAVKGFNGTVFAYGQTSSGKTFTMNGSSDNPGIIQLAVHDVFHTIQMTTDREFLIRVSYMEIYNEEINDLFKPENQKMQIHENLERGIFVAGLSEEIVNSPEQVMELIEYGEAHRHFGKTNINSRSSRSHTIFRMVIESRGQDVSAIRDGSTTDAVRVSVLNLVDLAGSERIAKTGAGGVRLKEGKYINKSLMTLGSVINKLSENGGRQRGHIPYRDSKLTRILQPALGGNAKTSIICTVAPEEVHADETKGTLQFASRAKRITNCVQVNEILTDAALLKRQKLEIEELKKKLKGSLSEVLELEILKLRNEMLKSEQEREKLALELEKERNSRREGDSMEELHKTMDPVSSNRTSEILQTPPANTCRNPRLNDFSKVALSKRLQETVCPESSPVPEDFANIADEDLWMRLNQGHDASDLSLIHRTPGLKHSSISSRSTIQGISCTDAEKAEANDLRMKLESALSAQKELEKNLQDQILINEQLMLQMSELKREALLTREYPLKIWEAVVQLKGVLDNMSTCIQDLANSEHSNTKFLFTSSDVGINPLSILATHISIIMKEGINPEASVTEQFEVLLGKLSTISAPVEVSNTLDTCKEWLLHNNFDNVSVYVRVWHFCRQLQQRVTVALVKATANMHEGKYQFLDSAKELHHGLEEECNNKLREERSSLINALSLSTQNLAMLNSQNEEMRKELRELHHRRTMDDKLKQFGIALSQQYNSFGSLISEVKLRSQTLTGLFSFE